MPLDETRFQFTPAWYTLGIATPDRLAVLQATWARGEDRSPEHYRWRAFKEFLTERRPLPPPLAGALYDLGAADADRAMGESIMHEIVSLPECPLDVLERARASGRKHLVKAATRESASEKG
jgi:hypothetical protein